MCMYCRYWPRQGLERPQRHETTCSWAGDPRAPLRATLGRCPTAFLRHWGPPPRPVLAHPSARTRRGGSNRVHGVPNRPTERGAQTANPRQAPSKMIWLVGAAPGGLQGQLSSCKTPPRPCLNCVHMCMYPYVSVCMCMYACIHMYLHVCVCNIVCVCMVSMSMYDHVSQEHASMCMYLFVSVCILYVCLFCMYIVCMCMYCMYQYVYDCI